MIEGSFTSVAFRRRRGEGRKEGKGKEDEEFMQEFMQEIDACNLEWVMFLSSY